MKKIFLYFLLLMGFATNAQPPKGEKIEALYIAYMTRELNLTTDDAKNFWPVHDLYDNEIRALRKDNPNMDELSREQAVLNIKKKYQDRFTKILGAERTNLFFIKDSEFRKKLTDRLKKMRQQNQNNPNKQQ